MSVTKFYQTLMLQEAKGNLVTHNKQTGGGGGGGGGRGVQGKGLAKDQDGNVEKATQDGEEEKSHWVHLVPG